MRFKDVDKIFDIDFIADPNNVPPFETMTETQKRDDKKHRIFMFCKNLMSEKQYNYFVERYGYKKPIMQIAVEYGVSPSTVSRTIKRGLARCRKLVYFK